jgi:hypothetical protein
MRVPRRWRWWGKWVGMIGAGVVALAFVVSGWWQADCRWYATSRMVWCAMVREGNVELSLIRQDLPGAGRGVWFHAADLASVRDRGVRLPRWRPGFDWLNFADERDEFFVLRIPLWLPLLLVGLPAMWLWYVDGRGAAGACARCGYDLSATASGVCPECGAGCQSLDVDELMSSARWRALLCCWMRNPRDSRRRAFAHPGRA